MIDILIIEDDSDCAQLLRLQLEQLLAEEARIEIVSNLQHFQYMLTGGFKPAIVMLDLNLPDAEGMECVTRVRSGCQDAFILLTTGRDQDHLVAECLASGADAYLRKGSGLKALSTVIRSALQDHLTAQCLEP
jgi:DNA-binding response OmpR family regulator